MVTLVQRFRMRMPRDPRVRHRRPGAAEGGGISRGVKRPESQTVQSWVDKGPNQPIAPTDLEKALGNRMAYKTDRDVTR